MRIFYVFYFEDHFVRNCLEAIRLFCNPMEKHPAHITVRGPYNRKIDIRRINSRIGFDSVLIDRVGNFFESNQNTVFFSCNSPSLKSVWNKPDYPYNPHITVYDGTSKDFATRVYEVLKAHEYSVCARVGGLVPLLSTEQKKFPVSLILDEVFLAKILGESIRIADVMDFSEERRLLAVDKIGRHLASYSVNPQYSSTFMSYQHA